MELKTTEQLKEYLQSKNIPFDKVTELPGGSGNFVWLLQRAGELDTIIKHAEPYIKLAPNLPFPQERMDFEANVIRLLGSTLLIEKSSTKPTVTLPTIYWYDNERYILQEKYAGSKTLKEAYQDETLDVGACGSRVGRWLAKLHRSTKTTEIGNNAAAKDIYRFAYQNLEGALSKYGFDGALGVRIYEKYGAMLQTDDDMVCHGDCWTGNVLVSEDKKILTIVDWEMCRRGCGATDVGQFAAEAFLLDRFQGRRGLMYQFLETYRAHNHDVSRDFVKRVAVHFATHLCFWPSVVEWGSQEETREVIGVGVEILSKFEEEDWYWFSVSDDSLLWPLFIGVFNKLS